MRAIVFGAGGQLGVEIARTAEKRGYEVRRHDRHDADISDANRVDAAIGSFDPQIVFNCAAYNQVDVAESEPQLAMTANGLGVRNLALACRQADALLVHFSTDYVFDGAAGRPYTETDTPHPLSAYAVSKYAGELYAQAYLDRVLIIRTSGVFGPAAVRTNRGNFVELMLRLANNGQPIRVVDDHVASPTYAPLLAGYALDLATKEAAGVFHVGGGTPISWYNYAQMIFSLASMKPNLTPTTEREYRTPARRPRFSALENVRIREAGLPPMPPLEEAVKQYFATRPEYLL